MAKKTWPYKIVGGIRVNFLPSLEQIAKHFYLDRHTGRLRLAPYSGNDPSIEVWWNKDFAHQIACSGSSNASGYRYVNMLGRKFAEHRLIWKIVHGRDPVGVIDHINGIRDDNRIENLRDVSPAQNALNVIRGRWEEQKRCKAEQATWDAMYRDAQREDRSRTNYRRLKARYEPESAGWSAMLT